MGRGTEMDAKEQRVGRRKEGFEAERARGG
jgi:hypothetical protein